MNNKQLLLLDASALKQSGCSLQLHNILVGGYRSRLNSNDIEFGTAFHHYRKCVEEHPDPASDIARFSAVKEALVHYSTAEMYVKHNKKFLDATYLKNTCLGYDEHYTLNGEEYEPVRDANGKPLVECRVAYPYYSDADVEILLCGTIDGVLKHKHAGFYAIKDYKTTSVWDVEKYFDGYRLSAQLMFYKLLLTLYARLYPTHIISQAAKGGAFIDGIFLASGKAAKYQRSEVFFWSEAQLAEFQAGVDYTIHEKILPYVKGTRKLWREGILTGGCEKVYGACSFARVCGAQDEESGKMILREEFIQRPYSPMTHGEVK